MSVASNTPESATQPPCESSATVSPDFSALQACIHCGLCLPACPTYTISGNEAESPRGRLYLMKGMWQGDERCTPDAIAPHIDACLGCLGCQTACPSGVPYGELLEATRQTLLERVPPTFLGTLTRWGRRLAYRWVLPNRGLLNVLTALLKVAESLKLFVLAEAFLALFTPLSKLSRVLGMRPRLTHRPRLAYGNADALQWLRKAQASGNIISPKDIMPTVDNTVALFTGCLMDAWFERVHAATLHVLLAQGLCVWVPPSQTCCGALAHHAGEMDIAHDLEARNLKAFSSVPVSAVLVNSAGCGSSMAQWAWMGPKSMDVFAFFAQRPVLNLPLSLEKQSGEPLRVAYHAACHLHHGQGVQKEPLDALDAIPGVARIALHHADMCCGSAGVYNLAHPENADAILAEKLATLPNSGVDVLVTANPGCLMQWQNGLRSIGRSLPVLHPVELMAQSCVPVSVDWHAPSQNS